MLFSSIIYAEEKRKVAVIYIPNAFIQKRVKNENEMAVINIRGVLMELLLEIDSDLYGPFETTDKKGKKLIFVQCMKSIYGTMVAILIYHKKFVKTLKRTGFQLNPFHP